MSITQASILEWIKTYAEVIAQNRDYLTQLDAAIGDADHGANMDRGYKAVMSKMADLSKQDIGSIFKTIGMTLISTVGGAGGPLYGTFFMQAGTAAGGKMELNPAEFTAMLEAAINGVIKRGKAEPGDKTMIDTLTPALETLKRATQEGKSFAEAIHESAEAARQGMEATIPLVARKGRASYLGERSAGHQDPGATSSYMLLQAAEQTLAKNNA
jgi:phosphoenolpyruvate---glycerone phosphotransferase subunit DhaL